MKTVMEMGTGPMLKMGSAGEYRQHTQPDMIQDAHQKSPFGGRRISSNGTSKIRMRAMTDKIAINRGARDSLFSTVMMVPATMTQPPTTNPKYL